MSRLLRPGGRLAFTTIHVAHGLTPAEHRRASAAGPVAVAGPDPADLLHRAGFDGVRAIDVTAEFLSTSRSWLAARLRHRDELRAIDPDVYEDRIAIGRGEIAALEAGLLGRTLYVASRPLS